MRFTVAFQRAAVVMLVNDLAKELLAVMESAVDNFLQVYEIADATNRDIAASLEARPIKSRMKPSLASGPAVWEFSTN
jgi:hypothetical protein